jgi:predicted NUDIX family NTP pyrophosphohydrolase
MAAAVGRMREVPEVDRAEWFAPEGPREDPRGQRPI